MSLALMDWLSGPLKKHSVLMYTLSDPQGVHERTWLTTLTTHCNAANRPFAPFSHAPNWLTVTIANKRCTLLLNTCGRLPTLCAWLEGPQMLYLKGNDALGIFEFQLGSVFVGTFVQPSESNYIKLL